MEDGFASEAPSSTELIAHSELDVLATSDLPAPTATASGATATIKTTGDAFQTGSATFKSSSRPTKITGTSCVYKGKTHTFDESDYAGTCPALKAEYGTAT